MILTEATARRVRHAVRRILPWLLLVAVAGNIGITLRFQFGPSHSVMFSESADLADLVDSTYPGMRLEYAVYAELNRLARGSTIAIPAHNPFDPDRLQFLAGMTAVDGPWYPEEAAANLTPAVSGLMWVEDRAITYSIVPGGPGDPYGAVRSEGLVLIAPIRLLEGAGSG